MPVFDQPECRDDIMLVTPRPGVNRENLLKTLQSVHTDVYNLRGGGTAPNACERLLAYVEWTSTAVRMLGNQVSNGDLDRLVLTERHRLLLAGLVGTATSTELPVQRVVNGLVSLELDERVADFDAAIKALQGQIARWPAYGHYVVPDTSFYIHHKDKLEAVDFGPLTNVWQSEIAVLVPIVIVDELDRLKESKDKVVRWRAGYTLAVLDRVFADGAGRAQQRPGDVVPGPDGLTRSEVTIELVFDPPGHVRLPGNDDEIIDRALAIEALADRKVTLLTYDTGQSTRARNAGLQVVKLSQDIGEEPSN
jgi:rRNA-processing protein FCF1